MRTFIAVLITLAVVGGGFGLYLKFASPDVKGKQRARKSPTERKAITTRATSGFGEGEHPWWEQYDEKGRRTSRIQAETYEPLQDGKYKVVAPRVDFFQNNGEVLRIEGRTGTITMQQGLGRAGKVTAGGSAGASANQTPRSGELKDVTIYLLPSLAADARPSMTLTMNNASFDNETYKVRTEAFETAGGSVPWDEVPVSVRGDEYDFDGRGLELQYNEVDKRLEYLRVVHGQKLLIKRPAKFLKTTEMREAAPATRPATQPVNLADAIESADAAVVEHVILAADQPTKAGSKEKKAEKAAKAAHAERAAAQAKKPDKPTRATTRPSTRPAETVYRASFQENVLIFQGGRQLASVHELQVDFIGEESNVAPPGPKAAPKEKSAQAPRALKTAKAQKAADRAQAQSKADARAKKLAKAQRNTAATRPAVPERKQGVAASPSTRPTEEPIEVRWTGPLVVTPVVKDRPEKLISGESIVRMIARPGESLSLTKPRLAGDTTQTLLQAARLTHWTMDQSALLEGAAGVPVKLDELKEGRRTEITTQRMHFLPEQGMALLEGKSSARLPVDDESASRGGAATQPATRRAEPQYLSAQWLERCVMHFEGKDVEDMVVKQADLRGAVAIDHAQLQMNSETLSLKFAPPATQPSVKTTSSTRPARSAPVLTELDATGKVHAVVRKETVTPLAAPLAPTTRPAAGVQVIDCDRLQMATAPGVGGKLYPRTIIAGGHVRAVDSERDLEAGNVKLTLKQPTTKPAAAKPAKPSPADFDTGDVEHLLATQQVKITTADGKRAQAESLEITPIEGKSTVILRGKPDAPAVVVREADRLVGPEIRFSPETQEFAVMGAGRIDGQHRETPGGPGLPVAVTWNNNVIGKNDVITADGGVRAASTDSDGANNSATGQRVLLITAPKPATRPAVASTEKKPTTKPSDLDVMANRDITGISLEGGAETRSELFDAAGKLLRLVQLKSDRIHWTQEPGKGRKLVVPGAGTMLVVDERDPARDKAAQEAAKDPLGVRGRTAFSWHDSLTYDELKKQVEMKGSVEVGRLAYKPQTRPTEAPATKPAAPDEPMRLFGDRILADVEEQPVKKPATNPAAKPPKNAGPLGMGSDFSAKMQFRKVTVEGNVAVQGGKINIQADSITYEPASHRLTARGTARNPVRQFDKDGLEEARFDSVVLDTDTGHVLDSRGMVITRRSRK